jgi:hypothetical protein
MSTVTFQRVLQETLTRLSIEDSAHQNTPKAANTPQVAEIITTYRMLQLQPLRSKSINTQGTERLFVPKYTEEKLLPLIIADTLQASQSSKMAA